MGRIIAAALLALTLCAASNAAELQVNATNPRYFDDMNGNPVALMGHQTTVDFQDNAWWGVTLTGLWGWTTFDDYLTYITGHGMNYIRAWIVWHTSDPDQAPVAEATPMMYSRSGTSGANDGGNKFDLESLNQTFFDRVATRVGEAEAKGVIVSVMLFEVYGFMDLGSNSRWHHNPWNPSNNIQGGPAIDANSDGHGIEFFYNYNAAVPNTTPSKTILDLQKEYVEKMVDTLAGYENVIYEIANELRADTWQNLISDHLQTYQAANYPTQQKLVLISASGRDINGGGARRTPTEALAMDADVVNWAGQYHDKTNPTAHNYAKPVIADMDHIDANVTGETPNIPDPWKSALRGYNFSRYDGQAFKNHSSIRSEQDLQRKNIGRIAHYLNTRVTDLEQMTPQNSMASTGYCLCDAGEDYLVFNPGSGSFTVTNLSVGSSYDFEWYNTSTGTVAQTGSISPPSSVHQFTPPGNIDDAVLFLQRGAAVPPPQSGDKPLAGLNNQSRHPWQHPVTLSGESVVSGWSGKAPLTIPDLTAARASCLAGGASADLGTWRIIKDDAGVTALESLTAATDYDGYFICPGNRLAAAGGHIQIRDSGTALTDAGVVKVVCVAPTRAGQEENAWQRNPSPEGGHAWETSHDYSVECVLPAMDFTDEDYWFVHNVTLHRTAPGQTKLLQFDDSTGIVFDHSWIDCSHFVDDLQGEGGNCVQLFGATADTTVQYTVIGPQANYFNMETICYSTLQHAMNNTLANSRVFNCGKNIQNGGNTTNGTGAGQRYVDVDTFQSPDTRLSVIGESASEWYARGVRCRDDGGSECGSNEATSTSQRYFYPDQSPYDELFDPNGDFGCSQTLLSFKGGSDDPNNPAVAQYVRAFGRRAQPVRCGGDGTLASSSAFGASQHPRNAQILDSISFDNGEFFGVFWTQQTNPDYSNILLEGNLHYSTSTDMAPYSDDLGALALDFSCKSPCTEPMPRGLTARFNTILAPNAPLSNYHADPFSKSRDKTYLTYDCNIIVGANASGSNTGGTQNVNLDGSLFSSLTNTASGSAAADMTGDFTFWADLEGNPFQVTIPGAIPREGVSWAEHCTQPAPAADLAGNTRVQGATIPGALMAARAQWAPVYINVGGSQYTDGGGNSWQACNGAAPDLCAQVSYQIISSGIFYNNDPISGTSDDELFQYFAASQIGSDGTPPTMIATIPVEAGQTYDVSLLFAEHARAAGDRQFDVDIDGARVWENLDINAEAGGLDAALIKTHTVTPSSASLVIGLAPSGLDAPILAGISVEQSAPATGPAIPFGLNNIIPGPDDIQPVIWPALNNACRAGYTCHSLPATCDTTFTGAENEATIEASLNNVSNGPAYCFPPSTDLTGMAINITRDCTAARCWIVPTDVATRSLNAALESAPTFEAIELAGGAHNWGFAGLAFDGSGSFAASSIAATADADGVVIAHNSFFDFGNGGNFGSIELRGDNWSIYSNIAANSYVAAGIDQDWIRHQSGDNARISRNTCRDPAGSCYAQADAATLNSVKLTNNHFAHTGLLYADSGGGANPSAGAYVCAESLIELSAAGNDGEIYGNLIEGQRRGESACGGTGTGIGYSIKLRDNADGWQIYWNGIWDAHAGIGGESAGIGTDGSTVSANFIELGAYGDGESPYPQYALGVEDLGGSGQVWAFNSVHCLGTGSNGPNVWQTGAEPADIKYNLFIDCASPGTATESGGKQLLNAYVGNAIDGAAEVPSVDDSVNQASYTTFSLWGEVCTHTLAQCAVKSFHGVVPPVGGALDDLFQSPAYTTGRGTGTPHQKWGE